MLLAGLKRVDGYAGLEPAKRLDYHQVGALQLAGVDWIQKNETTATIAGLLAADQHWLRVPAPLARARLVANVRLENISSDLAELRLAETALVSEPLDLPPGPPGTATITRDRPGSIEVRTSAETRQLLVVAESYHRGWQASVEGRAAPVIRVNGDFLGCVVAAGNHRVRLEFRPPSLRAGKILSGCGLGLMLCFFIVNYRRAAAVGGYVESSVP
jgi:hypothetical protein